MKKLAILGLGHIGGYVYHTLSKDRQFQLSGHDIIQGTDLSDDAVLRGIIAECDGVLVSTPYNLNVRIAELCDELGRDYFDLTESVAVTDRVKTFKSARFVTQCGLAPGMVSIIANKLAGQFERVQDIAIRVGALPENASNHMRYYRTWNTLGLINEYIYPCPALIDGRLVELEPLADQESVLLNGASLEAANTSGGLGSLADSFLGRARNVTYKTLRYPGHWDHMRFLRDDMGLAANRDMYVRLFDQHVPQTDRDFVFVLVSVTGWIGEQFTIRQYSKIVDSVQGHTAIQRTTAGGVMSVLDCWAQGSLDDRSGWIRQEELDHDRIWSSQYSACYH